MNYITINKSSSLKLSLLLGLIGGLNLTGCSINEPAASTFTEKTTSSSPGKEFDLSHWKLTLPTDIDSDGKVDGITTAELQNFVHSDFFYLDEQGHMVFTAPNRGATTANSKNTRSELRYMSRGADRSIKTQDPLKTIRTIARHMQPLLDKFTQQKVPKARDLDMVMNPSKSSIKNGPVIRQGQSTGIMNVISKEIIQIVEMFLIRFGEIQNGTRLTLGRQA